MSTSTSDVRSTYSSAYALGMRTGPADADVYNKGQAKFDEWLAEHDRALAEKVWSEGHSQAMANVAWPKERKGNPYTKEEA